MTQSVSIKDDLGDLGLQALSDVAGDDSDKSFTVPADEEWCVVSVIMRLTATATAGSRLSAVEVQEPGGRVLNRVQARLITAANETRTFVFGRGLPDVNTALQGDTTTGLPEMRLGPGFVLRMYDRAVVDPTADDLEVDVLVRRRRA